MERGRASALMGGLIIGRPALKLEFAVSVPVDVTAAMSLVFRAADAPGLDPWLMSARRSLSPAVQHDLDTLLGFSGRMLYYVEELLFSFNPFQASRLDASFDDYLEHLENLPAWAYRSMLAQSVLRIYRDRGITEALPIMDDPSAWRTFLEPGITRADVDEVVALAMAPEQLKARTVMLVARFWDECYGAEFERVVPELRRAVRQARSMTYPGVAAAFADLSHHRLPDEVQLALPHVERVTFCPCYHLGSFVQFILYPPELILFFNCEAESAAVLDTWRPSVSANLLPGLRALADGTRLRIVEMLRGTELYAQEIVGRLGISQSAVSRHLATLEAADIITVRPVNGMKYYAINTQRLRQLAEELEQIGNTEPLLAVSRP